MFTEKELRRAIREELRIIVTRHNLQKLNEEEDKEKADVNFDPEGTAIPKALQKMLDPDITPQKFAQLDSQLDDAGNPKQQALAVAVYALNYADNDLQKAKKLLSLATAAVPNLLKQGDQETPAKE